MTDKKRYSDKELEEFKQLIIEKINKAKEDYNLLKSIISHESSNDTEDTSPTFKVLEEGAATLSKEEAGKLAQRQYKFLQHLEAALIRIENKTYGICRETGKLIGKERLRAVPHATLCIEAKQNQR
ncbi:MAG: TraR/DksA C4-type zinc finger protein [Bacteroidales bacterium]|nr:TraR/DksA C4-type zinc finger protein [Bacteroidales bacterium]